MKILITGANGFIGRQVLLKMKNINGCVVEGVSFSEDIAPEPGYDFDILDLTDSDRLMSKLNHSKPDVIINTAAISAMAQCEENPAYAKQLNTDMPGNLAAWCRENSARLVHISTDTVFSGREKRFHSEDETVSPPNVYGATKAEAERLIQERCSDYAIIRVVLVYGVPLPRQHGNIVKLVYDKLSANESVKIVNDQWRTPTFVQDVADATAILSTSALKGIWHICGKECFSIYEIACKVAEAYGFDRNLIMPISTDNQGCSFERPQYGLLDISKAEKDLNFKPLSLDDALKTMKFR